MCSWENYCRLIWCLLFLYKEGYCLKECMDYNAILQREPYSTWWERRVVWISTKTDWSALEYRGEILQRFSQLEFNAFLVISWCDEFQDLLFEDLKTQKNQITITILPSLLLTHSFFVRLQINSRKQLSAWKG